MKFRQLLVSVLVFTLFLTDSVFCFQTGNTISGYIFDTARVPVYDITVELLDDYSRTVARTKTNASGRYNFSRISSGRYKVRILTTGSDFLEQEQEVEIQNFLRPTENGGLVATGFDNVQRDFYLRKRQLNKIAPAKTIFVQEIPPKAQEYYDKALKTMEGDKKNEGLELLKKAIEEFPNYFSAYERLGVEYVKLGYFEAAKILLDKATEINPRAYNSWYSSAYSLYKLNLSEEAFNRVSKALELDPKSSEALLLNGVILRKLKKYEAAEQQFQKAKSFAVSPIPDIHWQLALLYAYNLKRFNEAANELEVYLKFVESSERENILKLIKQFREKARKS